MSTPSLPHQVLVFYPNCWKDRDGSGVPAPLLMVCTFLYRQFVFVSALSICGCAPMCYAFITKKTLSGSVIEPVAAVSFALTATRKGRRVSAFLLILQPYKGNSRRTSASPCACPVCLGVQEGRTANVSSLERYPLKAYARGQSRQPYVQSRQHSYLNTIAVLLVWFSKH